MPSPAAHGRKEAEAVTVVQDRLGSGAAAVDEDQLDLTGNDSQAAEQVAHRGAGGDGMRGRVGWFEGFETGITVDLDAVGH